MTINKTLGQTLSFKDDIEEEFGPNPGRSLGQYRREDPSRVSPFNPSGLLDNSSPDGSSLSNLPLDDGLPNNGEIKFSDFYGKKLNMVVDYYSGGQQVKQTSGNNQMAATWRFANNPAKVKVVGGFRGKPNSTLGGYNLSSSEWQGGKRVIVNVNKTLGGRNDGDISDVALRTGSWPAGTELQVDVGSSGQIRGGGGAGGNASIALEQSNDPEKANGFPGGNGTSALGIEYPAIINNGGLIRCGYGGGGGGSGAANDPSDKSDTDFGRSGGGGGGGAGLPAGNGGSGGTGGFNGDAPLNGGDGGGGQLNSGGQGGNGPSEGGADAGEGGNGGDIVDAPTNGVTGTQDRTGIGYDAPGTGGPAGSNGRGVLYSSNSVQQNSSFTGNSADGGAQVLGIN